MIHILLCLIVFIRDGQFYDNMLPSKDFGWWKQLQDVHVQGTFIDSSGWFCVSIFTTKDKFSTIGVSATRDKILQQLDYCILWLINIIKGISLQQSNFTATFIVSSYMPLAIWYPSTCQCNTYQLYWVHKQPYSVHYSWFQQGKKNN